MAIAFLGIREYWVVNSARLTVLGWALAAGGQTIEQSQVLPGLPLDWVETALRETQSTDLSTACGQLMQRLVSPQQESGSDADFDCRG